MMLFFDSGSSNSTTEFQEVWVVNTYSESKSYNLNDGIWAVVSVYICYIDYALITKKPCIILHCIVFSKNTLSLNALISGYLSYPFSLWSRSGSLRKASRMWCPNTYPSGLQNSHVRLRDFNSLSADMRTLLLELFAYDQVKNSCRFIKHSWLQTTTIMSSHAYLNAKKHPTSKPRWSQDKFQTI